MTRRSIPSRWLKNKTEQEQDAIRHTLETNTAFIDSLLSIIAEMKQEEENAECDLKDYSSPSWPYLQANRNGAKRAYSRIEALFSIKTMETNIGK